MKRKLFLILFALPFFGIGLWMLITISLNTFDAWQMQSWESTPARLSNAGYKTHRGDDSDNYEAYADYAYSYHGRDYTNSRVAIAAGADNIGNYQVDLGRRLSDVKNRGELVDIYVNPVNPQDSVIDRDLRWSLIGFKSIFVFAFGGIGLGLIIFTLRAPKAKDMSEPKYKEQPWLANDHWQTATIKSNSKTAMYASWGFAAFWNLISAPLPFVVYQEFVEKDNYAGLLGLLFPLVGIGLFVSAFRRSMEWKRFGPAPVTLDPFPGAIGGHIGGIIDIRLPYDSESKFLLSLTCVNSYVSGSGKSRSRKESVQWQDTQWLPASSGSDGSRLSFRFDVPDNLSESDAQKTGDSYYLWRLNVKAELPGTDIDRDYEIPVYSTGEESRFLSGHIVEISREDNRQIDDLAVRAKIQKETGIQGTQLYYPAGRNLGPTLVGLIIGSIFAGGGWFLMFAQGEKVMGGVFGIVGSVIALGSLYSMLNSLKVIRGTANLRTERRILGIPVARQQMRRDEFLQFSKKVSLETHSGGKHTQYFAVIAEGAHGQKLMLGEGFKGSGEADAAIRFIARALGLSTKKIPSSGDSPAGINVLTADR
jgi:hypothetical protein